MQTLSGLIEQSLNRIKEATIGVLDVTDDKLRGHLRQLINNELGNENCFLADPVVEQTFGWESADCTFADLAEQNLFSAKLTDVLAKADNYDFPKTARPYIHQLQAWRHLLADTPQSAIITSGTGSGKTECFMIPILEDLIRRQTQENTVLVGVQALFLYPLNALINSQKERLDAWTKPFGNKIRFCLYNGNTKESAEPRDKDQPNQVLSRELLRKEPPPILLTNATMLEYMLVRRYWKNRVRRVRCVGLSWTKRTAISAHRQRKLLCCYAVWCTLLASNPKISALLRHPPPSPPTKRQTNCAATSLTWRVCPGSRYWWFPATETFYRLELPMADRV